MMNPSEINRPVATVNRNAWYLRVYLWLYDADIEKVDFCRLFWGFVFAVPIFLTRIFLTPFFLLFDGFMYMKRKGFSRMLDGVEWGISHTIAPPISWMWHKFWSLIPQDSVATEGAGPAPITSPTPLPYKKRKKPKKESRILAKLKSIRQNGGEAFLSGVGKTADKGVELGQRGWPYVKWIFIVIGAIFAALLAGFCGYALWLLIGVLPVVAGALWTAITATASGIAWLTVTIVTSKWVWFIPLVIVGSIGLVALCYAASQARPTRVAATKTKGATLSFGQVMKTGAKSVKYRTCPVIKIEE